ncbi:hypothetical protein HFO68_15620 [Rhizobium laguerreae]|uniref:hypothetical protein n=1 Tax=Rhizobium laguerreae TaxID=1076926 RepID=UPI00143F2A26|nr:hypothetical protein [Rhizobium laguerreae]MBN9981974.1 hypothetical protein [Rhizobium laguerreae]MBY3089495.1 hypothetical protein [Rhizobium laguerreae]MBY3098691.1 hypothetical protein [Rhizobium laguerreae]MBY3105979.1 hypothetical protein [Rhizobium laguerreae]MBY3160424.1 hypothetical protein [Rhizobium laguerreae]
MAVIVSVIDEPRSAKLGKALIFTVWLTLASALCWSETVWRDEVRALSLALQGDNFIDMLRQMHGEGHPALWYILLRAAYVVVGSPVVLKVVALTVAAAAAYLLVFRLKLPLSIMLLSLFSSFSIFDYAAMSRNYGISMLVIFLIVLNWEKGTRNGLLLGLLFALLANTNVHSVVLVGGFLAYWFFGLLLARPRPPLTEYRAFATAAAVAAVGVVLCFVTVYPTFNDTGQNDLSGKNFALFALGALAAPSSHFMAFYPDRILELVVAYPLASRIFAALMSVLIYASLLALANRRPAMIAAGLVLLGLSLLFTLVYPGGYRHQVLWLVFMIAITALTRHTQREGAGAASIEAAGGIVRFGRLCFLILLALQVVSGIEKINQAFIAEIPLSRSKDFGAFMQSRPDLKDAVIIADPDYLVEALPYYVSNRTYLLREERFGAIVRYTRNARLSLSLADILQSARRLQQSEGVPVIILLSQRLDRITAPVSLRESYVWRLSLTPEEISAFQSATELVKSFGAVAGSDETYDAYVLK